MMGSSKHGFDHAKNQVEMINNEMNYPNTQ
jgi:hypothetical protein